jgi:MFS family permease
MDTLGAVLGPLLGYFFLRQHPGAFRQLYLLAFIPALLGVITLVLLVRERPRVPQLGSGRQGAPPSISHLFSPGYLRGLSPEYRRYLLIVGLFGLGNSSDAFLLLRAQGMGVGAAQLLLLYASFNCVEALLGYAAGSLSDRVGRRPLIATGYVVFAAVYLGFAVLNSPAAAWVLISVYGLYYTLTQGVQKALAADLTNPERRGSELGIFHMVVGLAALPASLIAGGLYTYVSKSAPFYVGALAATTAAVLLLLANPRRRPGSEGV